MPWLSYEFKDSNKIKFYLEFKQQIVGIPCLLVLNPNDGSLISKNGRGQIQKFATDAFDKWVGIAALK